MKPDRHYHKQVIKVNILSSRTNLLHRLPLALFQAVTPYPSESYSLYPARGSHPSHWVTLACTCPLYPVWTLILHVRVVTSPTATWGPS